MVGAWGLSSEVEEAGQVAENGLIDVVVVDDHVALRQGLEVLLERRGCRVVGSAGSASEGEEAVRTYQPDVAVIDIRLADESGLALVRRLLGDMPDLKVVVYTGIEDAAILADALESGARGFVLKPGPLQDLVDAIRDVRRGGRYVDPRLAELVQEAGSEPAILTKRERQIFDLLAEGVTGEEIARRLFVSPETVRTHVRNAMKKLHAHTRTEAVVQAWKRKEIGP
jgi:DNA-binding NarL/FixJ family response regulator